MFTVFYRALKGHPVLLIFPITIYLNHWSVESPIAMDIVFSYLNLAAKFSMPFYLLAATSQPDTMSKRARILFRHRFFIDLPDAVLRGKIIRKRLQDFTVKDVSYDQFHEISNILTVGYKLTDIDRMFHTLEQFLKHRVNTADKWERVCLQIHLLPL